MSVLRPRNRLVNFRLSEDEFELLRDSCELFGARSISDFARTSVLERLSQRDGSVEGNSPVGNARGENPVGQLGTKVAELEMRVGQILNLLQATAEEAESGVRATEAIEIDNDEVGTLGVDRSDGGAIEVQRGEMGLAAAGLAGVPAMHGRV
ncbi:MAG: hypothetical protein R2762_15015 [Bryobacteraceae bacterium]